MSAQEEAAPQEITALVGREVYTNNGVFVGEVEDLQIDLNRRQVTGLAIGQINGELFAGRVERGQGVLIPYRIVRAVGDIIIVADVLEHLPEEDEEEVQV